jgi:hypothetical protein
MTAHPIESWSELFAPPGAAVEGQRITMRVLRKSGRPFLFLPPTARHAVQGLQLYPAQRWLARALVRILGLLLRTGLPVPPQPQPLLVARCDPLLVFLTGLAGGELCPFAVLAGNPAAAGRRFIVVLWPPQHPAVVVKLGASRGAARALIEQEENFLHQIPEAVPGIPRVLQGFRSDRLVGFALPFLVGASPAHWTPALTQLLCSWVQPARTVAVSEIPAWRRLRSAVGDVPGWSSLAATLTAQPVATTVAHGDFAPWNVRVEPTERVWALDWERGEFPGMPAWDWFHFEIQTAILVQRQHGAALAQRTAGLLNRADFRAYAAIAGLAGRERAFLLAYLHHVVHVLQPTECGDANRELLAALTAAWPPAVTSPSQTT